LIAATDGEKAILVSGREAKATVQWRNKRLASIQQKQSKKTTGSRRWKRIQRRKARMLAKAKRRPRDITHKATRKVADAFLGATCHVGQPFNGAAQKLGRRQAQQVSSACNAKIIHQLDYKTCGAIQQDEHYSSQTCPVCGERNKCSRTYRCRNCGFTAPRDVVGSSNILAIGQFGFLVRGCRVPNPIHFVYPSKYPGKFPGSSGGHPASSSESLREAPAL
jgi:putative transposase